VSDPVTPRAFSGGGQRAGSREPMAFNGRVIIRGPPHIVRGTTEGPIGLTQEPSAADSGTQI